MPFIKSTFLRKATGGAEEDTVTVFNSMLEQKETLLYKEGGRLSPADYDELIKTASGFIGRLDTPSKRASINSKIAIYEKEKIKLQFGNTNIESLKKQIDDGYRKASFSLINSPGQFVGTRIAEMTAARQVLIDRLSNSDYEDTDSEYAVISDEINRLGGEITVWQKSLEAFDGGAKNAFKVYVNADPSTGNPIQLEYVPASMNPTLVKNTKPTNLTIDGMPVETTLNLGEDSRYLNTKLFGKNLKLDKNFAIGGTLSEGGMGISENNIDLSSDSFQPSEYIPPKSFIKSNNEGVYYEKTDADNYCKYTQTDETSLNAKNAFSIPQAWEERISSKVNSSINANEILKPQPLLYTPSNFSPMQSQTQEPAPEQAPAIEPRGPSEPAAIQQPQGQELQKNNYESITKGGAFKELFTGFKNWLNK